jgi:protein-tyrosine phosphatase
MPRDFYPIETNHRGRLIVVARPRGGDWLPHDVQRWKDQGVDVVVSLLTSHELAELQLEEEIREVELAGMNAISFPISDRGLPAESHDYMRLIANLADEITAGRSVAIHCRMSVGRAPMLAACVLIKLGISPEAALDVISQARGVRVPETNEQRRWIDNHAREISALTA